MELLMHLRKGILSAVIPVAFIIAVCPFSTAFADVTPVENDGAINFVHELSSASAIPEGDLVAVMANANSIYTGVNWVNDDGTVALKNQLSPNLLSYKKNVLYGSKWEELTSEQQTQWGSSDNYNAANFNSSLDAYGLGDARDRYYSSGGGSFEFTTGESTILDNLKGLYDDWSSGKDVLISRITSVFDSNAKEDFSEYLGVTDYAVVDSNNYDNWPSGAEGVYYVNRASYWQVNGFYNNRVETRYWLASRDVYVILKYWPSGSSNVAYTNLIFSLDSFTYGNSAGTTPSLNTNSSVVGSGTEQQFYNAMVSTSVSGSLDYFSSSIKGTQSSYNLTSSQATTIERLILFGDNNVVGNIGKIEPDIDGFPEDLSQEGDVAVFFPTAGITQDTSWTQYIEQIAEDTDDIVTLLKRILTEVKLLDTTSEDLTDLENLVSRFQFFATGQLKVHDEGVFDSLTDIGSDIHDILQQLMAWPKGDAADAPDVIGDFDFPELQSRSADLVENISSLAPFGATLLLSQMVAILSQTGNIQKPEMVIDFDFFTGHSYDVIIDLSWLDDGRVYINAFCIIALVLCLINVTIRIIEMEAAS